MSLAIKNIHKRSLMNDTTSIRIKLSFSQKYLYLQFIYAKFYQENKLISLFQFLTVGLWESLKSSNRV